MFKFVFIIPFRNMSSFISQCATSLISQNYENWRAIFIDDASDDDSLLKIPNDDRFTIIKNKERLTALPNIHYSIMNSNIQNDDVICLLDGDDMLLNNRALDILNKLYQSKNPMLTYGQYITSNGYMGHCKPYNPQSFLTLRTTGYWASHLRTFKFKLYKELVNQDPQLKCYKDNTDNFYKITYDIAIMLPLMEICGFENVGFNPEPIYFYRLHDKNDHIIDAKLQKSVADEIFAKPKFKQIF